ncbi:MAG: undecaprenyl/decaprenyl-phosphate alpha-N-acetylglucosaminyl 1-phosphate transferase [Phycisphaeraceae bacterium]|nr:undecaprenyl/decaprenyl-phosphate alpha-N-acetylglucosaminyl 1-phosphate transferase [Phycisphaeraceae bacterium]
MTPTLSQTASPAAQPDWAAAWTELLQFWPVLALSFGATLILTPIMRKLAITNGIVDLPDARRKAHAKPVAYLGGLAIFLGWLVGMCVFIGMLFSTDEDNAFASLLGENLSAIAFIAMGATAIVLTGLFDDVYGIQARVKIGGQLFAAAAIAQTRAVDDVIIRSFALVNIDPSNFVMQVVGTALIAVLVVGCCNAMNLIDGLDGLSSGVTAIAMAGMLAICALVLTRYHGDAYIVSHLGVPILLSLATIGAVAGFLPYNFNPASIFMGDTGSLLLGYLCVVTILFMGRLDDDAGLSPTVFTGAVICFALPLTDTFLAIVRRKLSGRPIFAPDAMHMHHMFRRCGLSVKKSVLAMYTLGLIFAVIGFSLVLLSLQWRMAVSAFGLFVLLILVVGYRVSCRLRATEAAHPKPAEGPDPPAAPKQQAQTG